MLNSFVKTELNMSPYTVAELLSKIYNIYSKAQRFYGWFRRPRETDDEDILIDAEAAVLAWQNFRTSFDVSRNRPTLGPGAANDSSDAFGGNCSGR